MLFYLRELVDYPNYEFLRLILKLLINELKTIKIYLIKKINTIMIVAKAEIKEIWKSLILKIYWIKKFNYQILFYLKNFYQRYQEYFIEFINDD